jgi:hypothetical protein
MRDDLGGNTMTSDADSAPVDSEDYPETAAGMSHGAGDAETELVPPVTVAGPEHAWSTEEPVTEAFSRPWRSVWAIAGIGVLGAIIVAFAIFGVVAVLRESHGTQTASTAPTPSAAPLPLADDTIAAKPPSPSPAEDPSTAIAAPPPVETLAPPKPVAPPRSSQAELDERFLADITAGGMQITDVRAAIEGAHATCTYLAQGHSEPQALAVAMRNNASLTRAMAITAVDAAIAIYCPTSG